MSATSEDISNTLGLDISAGRRSARRKQARRGRSAFSFTPVRRLKAMLRVIAEAAGSARARPLTLNLREYTVSFSTPAEFEFALSSRTDFPVRKLSRLMQRSTEDLEIMAANIRQVERRFTAALAQSLHRPELISELLRGLNLKWFSLDHQWRDVVEALNHQGPAGDVYKRIALIKYMQYLGSRQDVLRNLYLDKVRAAAGAASAAAAHAEPAGDGAGTGVAPRAGEPGESEARSFPAPLTTVRTLAGETEIVSPRDTAIFHIEQIALEGDTEGFALLPRGATLEVTVEHGECVELLLSSYRLKLYPGQRYRLTDQDDNIHILPTGKSVVGRHNSADIVVAADNRTISRRHLMIEPVSANTVKLTDLSSHGTSIPLAHLHQAGQARLGPAGSS